MGNFIPEELRANNHYLPRSQGMPARWGGHVGLELRGFEEPEGDVTPELEPVPVSPMVPLRQGLGVPGWVWALLVLGAIVYAVKRSGKGHK